MITLPSFAYVIIPFVNCSKMSLFNISCALFSACSVFPCFVAACAFFFTYFCISVAVQHLFSAISSPDMSSATLMALFVASEETQKGQEAEEAEEAQKAQAAA